MLMPTKTINQGGTYRTMLVAAGNTQGLSALSEDCGLEMLQGPGLGVSLEIRENASAEILALIFPGADCSLDFNIELTGPGASCNLYGLYLCPEAEKVSVRADMHHKVHHCHSHQLFKGIISGTARSGFTGKIVVSPDAQVTEAYQENHNLLLSDTAVADTSPQLEIYADDVKCSHGATIGRLDEDEQFYMRSRGIPESEARALQMLSFISPVLDIVRNAEDRELLADYIGNIIRTRF